MIRIVAAPVLAFCAVSAARAEPREEKKCILAAAQTLPGVPGLTITASRAEPTGKSGYKVVIEFEAAKLNYTASFDCLINGPGAVAKMNGLPE